MPAVSEFIKNDVIKLDQVDRKILSFLQIDGRSSASNIADKIGMSVPAVADRIKKLNDWMNEVILDYPPIKFS